MQGSRAKLEYEIDSFYSFASTLFSFKIFLESYEGKVSIKERGERFPKTTSKLVMY